MNLPFNVWLFIVVWVFILALVLLVAGVFLVWRKCGSISEDLSGRVRAGAAICAVVWGAVSTWRLSSEVAIPRELNPAFVPELIGYLGFWVLVPPIWFFLEYYAVDKGAVTVPRDRREVALKATKDYVDFASKIWAAVITILLVLVSLTK